MTQTNGDPRPSLAGLAPGDRVRVVTPENKRLHGAVGTVAALEAWGAHLELRAAATGRFRALWSEMTPAADDGAASRAVASGYTGDCCSECGSFAMRRTGACSVCECCGKSGGCG